MIKIKLEDNQDYLPLNLRNYKVIKGITEKDPDTGEDVQRNVLLGFINRDTNEVNANKARNEFIAAKSTFDQAKMKFDADMAIYNEVKEAFDAELNQTNE